ncbi:MAG: hypothetical protein E7265_08575 [Lachnospiraceae bacterium]|nr:hypothetical protein [Lachnospiraceae bacterium]
MRKYKSVKFFIAVVLFISAIVTYVSKAEASVKKSTCNVYSGSNRSAQNYYAWASTIGSYLCPRSDGGFMRIQHGATDGLLVEYYDGEYNLVSEKTVPGELPIFGGVYTGESNYYVVTGQTNANESADVEVYRVTKYDKNWNRISSTGLYDCNTTVPFDAGTCRMTMVGKYLLIRTCHEMYTSSDGNNHQANVTIQVDTDSMTITDSYTGVLNNMYGYVSHSFNQFIKTENNNIISVDHGDAYPRSIVLMKYNTDFSDGTFFPSSGQELCTVVDVLPIQGNIGANMTKCTVGGLEISESDYLIAGTSVVQDEEYNNRSTRNVFVAGVDKSTMEVSINRITDYPEGTSSASTPHMVKLEDNSYMILWTREGTIYYGIVDGTGKLTGELYSMKGYLSDCVPVISGDKIIWYTWNEEEVIFYDISIKNLNQTNTTVFNNGHTHTFFQTDNGIASIKCEDCGDARKVKVFTYIDVWWQAKDGFYYSDYNDKINVGDNIYYSISGMFNDGECAEELEYNYDIEIISSDETVAKVSEDDTVDMISFVGNGEVTLTFRPQYNPTCYREYKIIVGSSDADNLAPVPTKVPQMPPTDNPPPVTTKAPQTTPDVILPFAPTKAPQMTPGANLPSVSTKGHQTTSTDKEEILYGHTNAKKKIRLSNIRFRSSAGKITGKLSVSKAIVKIKIGGGKWKKAVVKGKKFTLKKIKLKNNVKIRIKITKKGYKTLQKTYKI